MNSTSIRAFIKLISTLENNKLVRHDVNGKVFEVEFKLNPSAEDGDITTVEKELGILLPSSFKEFLEFCDGAEIYNYKGIDGFKIFSTSEILLENKRLADEYQQDWLSDIIVFAECLGEGNYLAFKAQLSQKGYSIIDCFHEVNPIEWNVMEENFDIFLDKLIKNEGNKYWLLE